MGENVQSPDINAYKISFTLKGELKNFLKSYSDISENLKKSWNT